MVYITIMMGMFTQVNGRIIKKTEKGFFYLLMEISSRASSEMTCLMAMEHTQQLMVE